MNIHIEGLDPIHFLLAYAGMLIHILTKLSKAYNLPDYSRKLFFRKNIFPILISIIGIPLILVVATDPTVQGWLPINYVTATLAGWQTQSIIKGFSSAYGSRTSKNKTSKNKNTDTPDI